METEAERAAREQAQKEAQAKALKRARDLSRRAVDPASSPSEVATASAELAKVVAEHDLLSDAQLTGRAPVATGKTPPEGFNRGWVASRQGVMEQIDRLQSAIMEALMSEPRRYEAEGHILGVVLATFYPLRDALAKDLSARQLADIGKGLKLDAARLHEDLRRSALTRSDRGDSLYESIRALFAAEPEQPGVDAIARKLGRRASEVRDAIRGYVEEGKVLATGNGRARRYRCPRRGDVKPRPESGTG